MFFRRDLKLVLGNLVGDFTGYFLPNTTVTKQEFQKSVNQNAYVDTIPKVPTLRLRFLSIWLMILVRLYIFYLFIGKFFLSYISMVRISCYRISLS